MLTAMTAIIGGGTGAPWSRGGSHRRIRGNSAHYVLRLHALESMSRSSSVQTTKLRASRPPRTSCPPDPAASVSPVLASRSGTRVGPRTAASAGASAAQPAQVILNLCPKALAALPEVDRRPRHLTIRTERDEGNRVWLKVQDAGTGFEPQDVERPFDPIYTIKSRGRGIRLSLSRTIIESHHGRLLAVPSGVALMPTPKVCINAH